MQVMHAPKEGQFGDCFRACVASILELDPVSVPHFLFDGSQQAWKGRANKFLASHGLGLLVLLVNEYVEEVLDEWPDAFHILSGRSPRHPDFYHAVVARNGRVIHDPHPSRAGILAPTDEYPWAVDLFVSLNRGALA